jgi:hypothetical protein
MARRALAGRFGGWLAVGLHANAGVFTKIAEKDYIDR